MLGKLVYHGVKPLVRLSNHLNEAGARRERAACERAWEDIRRAPMPTRFERLDGLNVGVMDKRVETLGDIALDRWLVVEGTRIFRRGN